MSCFHHLSRTLTFALALIAVVGCLRAELDPERIVVVANQNDAESLDLALYYLEKRNIPRQNLIQVSCPAKPGISWETFVRDLYNPLKARLVETGWIDAQRMDGQDAMGRDRVILLDHKIDFLVTCRLPVRIEKSDNSKQQSTGAAVDSELALLVQHGLDLEGPLRNPLYGQANPNSILKRQVVRVSRLDGPTLESAKGMVDSALQAEKEGLIGRAYIDLSHRAEAGDEWLTQAAEILRRLHYPTEVDSDAKLLSPEARLDGLAFYFGWYTNRPYEAFKRYDAFRPGAIGWHIFSFSAANLRARNSWAGFFIDRGAAVTVGNVYEPFLGYTHHPHVLMEALAQGMTAGEALWASLPATSWMAFNLGDPLYRPFSQDLEAQLAAAEAGELTSRETGYVIERAMQAANNPDAAVSLGKRWFDRAPSAPLAAALGERIVTEKAGPVRFLRAPFPSREAAAPEDFDALWALAKTLAANGANREAAEIVEILFVDSELDSAKANVALTEAANIARLGGMDFLEDLLRRRIEARR